MGEKTHFVLTICFYIEYTYLGALGSDFISRLNSVRIGVTQKSVWDVYLAWLLHHYNWNKIKDQYFNIISISIETITWISLYRQGGWHVTVGMWQCLCEIQVKRWLGKGSVCLFTQTHLLEPVHFQLTFSTF